MKVCRALTIAGSDSGGGAGIQADLKTFAALGVHGMAAVTALTAQNTVTVTAIQDVDPGMVRAQIEAVVEDIGVDAAKTGMLHTQEIIEVVADQIARHEVPTVVDPVMVAKGGARLLEETAAETLIRRLLPLATVVTPNATEAATIAGRPIHSLEDAKAAARAIGGLGPQAVVVKGGHLPGAKAIDVLWHEGGIRCFEADRVDSSATHGTGCTFSAAIAAELAKGAGIVDAIDVAKTFMTRAIRFGLPIGRGHGPVNPMANLYHEAAKARVLALVKEAVDRLEACPPVSALIPESQTNIVMATPQAVNPRDVAGMRGRIVRVGGRVKASACPEFGASSHVARTVLVAMHHDPAIQAAMNIRYSEDLIAVCRRLGFAVSAYDRKEEPAEIKAMEGMTTRWGAEQAIAKLGRVPQVIYHTGDWGKEPMIILLGRTAPAVAEMAVTIAGEVKGAPTA